MIRTLRDAFFIARTDVSHMLRQRETILWVFLMPFLFFYFIGTVTGGFGSPAGDEDRPDPIALTLPPPGAASRDDFLAAALEKRLEDQGFAVTRPTSPEQLAAFSRRLSIRPGDAPATQPRSFTSRLLAGDETKLVLSHEEEGMTADYDRFRVSRAAYALLADLAVLRSRGETPSPESLHALGAMPRTLTIDTRPAGKRREIPSGFEQTIPGTMVMFTMLVLLTSGAVLLVVERRQGLLRRLASTPISRVSVVLGKWAGKMALGLVQVGFAMLAGTVVFGMQWGSALPAVAAVMVAWAACNASLGILLANLSRTESQTSGIGVFTTMLLAALGGCWWPIEITPDWMQGLAKFLPTGWTMDALHRLISFGDAGWAVLPHVTGLLAAAVVAGIFAARTFRYQ